MREGEVRKEKKYKVVVWLNKCVDEEKKKERVSS